MADQNDLQKDLLSVLSKHGVEGLPKTATVTAARPQSIGNAASYIREIITGDQAFDERVLSQVAGVLTKSVKP
ncbi:hypothetical protein [Sorangium sp. So ce1024]|uniref:hypothetical protein n=1 Tax=unclassified Sorangium TaxID=2621164 RepID=UPI003F02D192